MLRSGIIITVAAAVAATALAAEERKPRPKLPPDVEQVFGIAMAAPPEFAASALLRLVHRVPEKELRRDLMDMAFHVAAKAQAPVKLLPAPGTEVDTRSGSLAAAFRLNMDALSLQTRAIRDMIAVDPARAREMFGEMVPPSVAPAKCEDTLLPDVSPYYEAMAAVAQGTFTPAERARSEHLAFATAAFSRVSTIADLAPAARSLAALECNRQQYEIALGTLSSKLEGIPPDSRSFLHFSKVIELAIQAAFERARQLGAAPDPLIDAYRKFLVTQLRAPRCADSVTPAGMLQSASATELFGPRIRGDRPALTTEELTPELTEGEMKLVRYWQTAGAQRVYAECMKLRESPSGQTLSDGTRRSREWARQLTDFLSTLADWRAGEEASDADYYHEKATVYEALLELVPTGDSGDRVAGGFVEFLKSSNLQQRNPVEWFWHARETVNRVRTDHPERAAKILSEYRASGNIILMLEAMLDQMAL